MCNQKYNSCVSIFHYFIRSLCYITVTDNAALIQNTPFKIYISTVLNQQYHCLIFNILNHWLTPPHCLQLHCSYLYESIIFPTILYLFLLSLLFIVLLLSSGCCDTEISPFAGQIKGFWFWFCVIWNFTLDLFVLQKLWFYLNKVNAGLLLAVVYLYFC